MLNSKENVKVMKRFIGKADDHAYGDEDKQFLLESSISIASRMVISPDIWGELCSFNSENVGSQLIQRLEQFDFGDDQIEHIFVILYRFACEFDFSGGSDFELEHLLRDIDSRSIDLPGQLSGQITYAKYTMPVAITKRILNDPAINLFKSFPELSEQAKTQKSELETALKAKIEEVNTLKNTLDSYKDAFNFVGLHQGFGSILDKKQSELSKLRVFLILFSILLLVPIVGSIAVKLSMESFGLWDGVSFLLPIMSLEIILIYYFRIMLSSYNSLKAQIVQLELRQTLCQFIQGYSEYAIEIKKADKEVLAKFENIIFSNVLTDEQKIPSTFDGLESIGKLLKSIKNT
ncbi:hypothetical protein [Vibrio parahaemolyticus]|uniref:hypothetical protein n=1 Tax=Vibrio parahaemolyticus TaxID=670 RepID=UPI001D16A230|nr:hypothetical protein [Vibrio parahaemolyticus]MCC3817995.1 hypothetical protein [Vibrio parahaemolyticus]MCC3854663.1 hypothetical protein [Vibrio parahaemolyticus]